MGEQVLQIQCDRVTSWDHEDGCQVVFDQADESDERYLMVQRHFEEPDSGRCFVETDDPEYCGHFHLCRAVLYLDRFDLWLGMKKIEVSFAVSPGSRREAARVLQILIPQLEVRSRQHHPDAN